MTAYPVGEVRRLLNVKGHVLRYWEQEFPLVQPTRDLFGHKLYSGRDVRLLLRIRHLLHDLRFTVEGARARLLEELSGETQDLRANLDAARAELLGAYFSARNMGTLIDKALGDAPLPTEEE